MRNPQRHFVFSFLFLLLLSGVCSSALAQDLEGPTIRITSAPAPGQGPEFMDLLRARVTDPNGHCGARFDNCRVALFSFVAGNWFPQPFLNYQLSEIHPDGLVEENIHLGTRYAALVVFVNKYTSQPDQISILPTHLAIAGDEARAGTQIPEEPQPPRDTPVQDSRPIDSSPSALPLVKPTPLQSSVERSDPLSGWVWFAVLGLAFCAVLSLTGKVEDFVSACEQLLGEVIEGSYLTLRKLREALFRKLGEERSASPSWTIIGIFLAVLAIGAGVANWGVVKFSLEAFLPNTDTLSVLVGVFVAAKVGAGCLCHVALKNSRTSRVARLACFLVFALFLLSCVVDAFITYKRVQLIELVNNGTAFATDVTTQFSENALLMTSINVLMSCFEFVFAFAAFHLASRAISWLAFSPVLLPALALEQVLGAAHKGNAAGVFTTLIGAVLSAPKVIVLGAIELLRQLLYSIKQATKRAITSLIALLQQRRVRKTLLAGEVERVRLQQSDETSEVMHKKSLNDARRASLLEKQQIEFQFDVDEMAATLHKRKEANAFLRDRALLVARQNIAKLAEAFPETFASFVDKAEMQAQMSREVQLNRAAEAIAVACLNPILTMANAQSSLDGHYPPMKQDPQEPGKSVKQPVTAPANALDETSSNAI